MVTDGLVSRLKNNVLQTSAAEGGEEKQEAGGKVEDKEIEREVVKLQKKISQTEFVKKIPMRHEITQQKFPKEQRKQHTSFS